jgi:peptidyl-prolyl cis-trans isomerase A (cyclophilin A)
MIAKRSKLVVLATLALALPLAAQEQKAPPPKTPPAKAPATATKTEGAKPAETREPGLYMTFETEQGSISCKLFENQAPVTVRKIVGLAVGKIGGKRFYDGLIFHRVIPEFMIQGGDPLGTGTGSPKDPGFPFQDEFVPTLKFDVPGRLAMANSGPNTNGSQFFITEVPTPHLNNHHTIFGQCGNLDVVKAIARVPARGSQPSTPVHMLHVRVERVGPAPADPPEGKPAAKAPGKAPAKVPAKKSS